MADYILSDEQKKRLTEFLGETYHQMTDDVNASGEWCMCVCGYAINPDMHKSHTFSTPTDAHDLAKKLVEVKKWDEFWEFACKYYRKITGAGLFYGELSAWLFAEPESPVRLCCLVNAYLEEKE
jgi:hypothetical protein